MIKSPLDRAKLPTTSRSPRIKLSKRGFKRCHSNTHENPITESKYGISTPTSQKSSKSSTISTKPPRNPQFGRLDQDTVSYFTQILGPANVLSSDDPSALEAYNSDWTRRYRGSSQLVLFPKSTQHVAAILTKCSEKKLAVVPQSGNTGLVGGSTPVHDEIVLSMTKMNTIIDLNKSQGIVTCESGVILHNLTTFLEDNGFTTPLDLGAKATCLIGGNVSTNAGGLRVVRYGSLRGSILGLEVVTASGQILDLTSSMRKDNTGYDLKQLFIGGEGTLGVITKVSILCPPKPATSDVMYLRLSDFEQVVDTMTIARRELHEILSAIEFQDSTSVDILQKCRSKLNMTSPFPFSHDTNTNVSKANRPMYMLLECVGADSEINQTKIMNFFETVTAKYPQVEAVLAENAEQRANLWKLREYVPISGSLAGLVMKYDISLPLSSTYSTVEATRSRLETALIDADIEEEFRKHVHTVGYGHLGDGNLHLNVIISNELKDYLQADPTTSPKYDTIVKTVKSALEPFIFDVVAQNHGSISAEHGLGIQKNEINARYKSELTISYMKQIKHIFDPQGIMNPYKFLPQDASNSSG